MTTRRAFNLASGAAALVMHARARTQTVAAMRRVSILEVLSHALAAPRGAAFKQAMGERGWQEGQNIGYQFAYADSDIKRLDVLVAGLIAAQCEVIVVGAAVSAQAAQRATKSIPIVLTNVSNVIESGLVTSLARPGGNITGITSLLETLAKQIEVLHELTPLSQRIAILLNERHPSYARNWDIAQASCQRLKLTPLRFAVSAPSQLAAAAQAIVSQRAQAVAVVSDPMFNSERIQLQALLQATRLPVAYGLREHVVAGGLLSYASNFVANWGYAAKFVDKILRGAKPAELPVEQPTKFELVINAGEAKRLGLTIPPAVLLRADEVIP